MCEHIQDLITYQYYEKRKKAFEVVQYHSVLSVLIRMIEDLLVPMPKKHGYGFLPFSKWCTEKVKIWVGISD